MSMSTKLDRVVTYNDELSFINLRDPSMTWSCEVMWQINYVIFLLTLDQWPQNVIYREGLSPIMSNNPLHHVGSHDKLRTLNLHYRNAYGQ